MSGRSLETTVTFLNPFSLTAIDSEQPAGTYRLVTDEEEILGLSFLAFQRTATMLHLPAISAVGQTAQVYRIDPVELAAKLEADARTQP
jgi:hypothetical protein